VHRVQKIHVIDGGRHHGASRMPYGRQRAREIHQVHDLPAENVAQPIGIIGERKLRIFRLRFTNGFALHLEWVDVQADCGFTCR